MAGQEMHSARKGIFRLLTQPEPPSLPSINEYHLKYLLKICSFFDRFDELLQGPDFTKEELNVAIVH
jgi:hypothetical protein